MKQSLHVHTLLDDGRNSIEEMICAGIDVGLESVGFSGHSYLPFGEDWTMTEEQTEIYHKEIQQMRKKYTNIRIYEGLELDIYSEIPDYRYDYIIGSVHNLYINDMYISLDEASDILIQCIDKYFGGNSAYMAKMYFEETGRIQNADIIGHFDLITKFNEGGSIFNEDEYMDSAVIAMKKLASKNMIFEINTGAVSRGYRSMPYPSERLLRELNRMGGRITITSDAHDIKSIAFGYDDAVCLAKQCGFNEIQLLTDNGFKPVKV